MISDHLKPFSQEAKPKKKLKKSNRVWGPYEALLSGPTYVLWELKKKKKEKETERILEEIMARDYPNFGKDIYVYIDKFN